MHEEFSTEFKEGSPILREWINIAKNSHVWKIADPYRASRDICYDNCP